MVSNVAQGDVTIGTSETPQRVTVTGDVHLILADGCKLTVHGGIQVNDDDSNITNGSANKLTIYGQESGTGTLIANANCSDDNTFYNAGIGGGKDIKNLLSGTITINGGIVKAESNSGAGIGGGYIDTTAATVNVTITGGTVTATSELGAGIGKGYASGNGTFETTDNGNAVIFASSISDQNGKRNNMWSGVIFEGDSGQIYGSSVTPTESFEIPAGKTLTIDGGKILIIPDGVILTNNGTINDTNGNGNICVEGEGTLKNNGNCTCFIFCHLTLTNCKVLFVEDQMVKHDEKIYVKPGGEVTLIPNNPPKG